jgi:hypothetical protein
MGPAVQHAPGTARQPREHHIRTRAQIICFSDNDRVSEADQPIGVRLSVLDRKQFERDTPPDPDPSVRGWIARAEAESAIRLALDHDGTRIYLAPRGDAFTVLTRESDGSGASWSHPRWVLERHGAAVSVGPCRRRSGFIVRGIVPDLVTAVHVDEHPALLSNNAFVVEVPSFPDTVALRTPTGERRVAMAQLTL